jgi:hypothetical protein
VEHAGLPVAVILRGAKSAAPSWLRFVVASSTPVVCAHDPHRLPLASFRATPFASFGDRLAPVICAHDPHSLPSAGIWQISSSEEFLQQQTPVGFFE